MKKRKQAKSNEPRKNAELRKRDSLPVDWTILALADACKPL